MKLSLLIACAACALCACGGKRPAHSGSGYGVVLSDEAPPADYERLGELSVKSGEGCGVLGKSGSREDAESLLKDAARKRGGNYVQVTSHEPPRPNHQCVEHEHKLTGVAYRAPAPAPAAPSVGSASPTPPPVVASTVTPAAVSPVCTPGATQACLGPGACQGAQACRDDASGFMPCDCGVVRP